jgi:hypothetical protein
MPFYPHEALVPVELRTGEFLLRPLRAADVALDYEAVMATQEILRRDNGGRWPRPDFTLEENLADLQGHEADFEARRGFTYTVMDPTEIRCLGCVYAYPTVDKDGDGAPERRKFAPVSTYAHPPAGQDGGGEARAAAELRFWVRQDGVAADLDRRLLAVLIPWIREEFAFAHVCSPAWAFDERRMAILGAAGLRVVATHPVGDTQFLLFA